MKTFNEINLESKLRRIRFATDLLKESAGENRKLASMCKTLASQFEERAKAFEFAVGLLYEILGEDGK